MNIKHKFLNEIINIEGKEIIIIGTFNPDIIWNPAEYFYSRKKNHFWYLLPKIFNHETLLNKTKEEKKIFLLSNNIELTDLICSVDMNEQDIGYYSDEVLKKNISWNTDKILRILEKGYTKKVFFTRKSFNNKVKEIEQEIKRIEEFCNKKNIKFGYLPTPARFKNESKLNEWREIITK